MSSSESIEAEWYVARDGEQHGPISTTEVQELYSSGRLAPSDQLWSAELENWTPAVEVLGPPPSKRRSGPPPVPPPTIQPKVSKAAFDPYQSHQQSIPPGPNLRQGDHLVTQTVVEGGSFKFSTFIFIILGLIVPLWPITLPLCWFLAYRSYKKPSLQTVRVITEHR